MERAARDGSRTEILYEGFRRVEGAIRTFFGHPAPAMPPPGHPAARLAAVVSAMPPHAVGREETTAALVRLFPAEDPGFVAGLVERSGVERRHIALPLEQTLTARDFTARNAAYRRVALDVAERAARGALERASLAPRKVDVLIDVSCTGVAIPALDVALAPLLGLRSDVLRVPITESGCAAGGLALGLAGRLATQGHTCLVLAVELCSLTLCPGDTSRTNLVSAVLFGDGGAAAVVRPDEDGAQAGAPRLSAVGSHLFPGTERMMGFDVGTHGLRIVLQRELPLVLEKHVAATVHGFLAAHGRGLADVGLHLMHPGGRRILDTYVERLALAPEAVAFSREALRRYGNLSSASILTVLELVLDAGAAPPPGTDAFSFALGPGLSAELALWSWD
jgi:alkylresorcinol/alkylpyrone synthase